MNRSRNEYEYGDALAQHLDCLEQQRQKQVNKRIKLSDHHHFQLQQPSSTATTTTESWIKSPRFQDVLCGRGGKSNKWPGNVIYRQVVQRNKDHYQSTEMPHHKGFIVVSIIEAIHRQSPPGRFLRFDKSNNMWQEISRKEAFSKTGQALREQDTTSSTAGGGGGNGSTRRNSSASNTNNSNSNSSCCSSNSNNDNNSKKKKTPTAMIDHQQQCQLKKPPPPTQIKTAPAAAAACWVPVESPMEATQDDDHDAVPTVAAVAVTAAGSMAATGTSSSMSLVFPKPATKSVLDAASSRVIVDDMFASSSSSSSLAPSREAAAKRPVYGVPSRVPLDEDSEDDDDDENNVGLGNDHDLDSMTFTCQLEFQSSAQQGRYAKSLAAGMRPLQVHIGIPYNTPLLRGYNPMDPGGDLYDDDDDDCTAIVSTGQRSCSNDRSSNDGSDDNLEEDGEDESQFGDNDDVLMFGGIPPIPAFQQMRAPSMTELLQREDSLAFENAIYQI